MTSLLANYLGRPCRILGTVTHTGPGPFGPTKRVRVQSTADRPGFRRGTVTDVPPRDVVARDGSDRADWPALPSDAPDTTPAGPVRWLGPAEGTATMRPGWDD